MDLDKSTGDVAIIALGLSSNDDLKFGGVSIGPFGTCLNDRQPWIAKVNTNGQVQWTEVGTADPINCGHVYQQQVVLHHDGSVTAAGKSTGSGGLISDPILPPQAVSPHLGLHMLIVRGTGYGQRMPLPERMLVQHKQSSIGLLWINSAMIHCSSPM